MGSGTVNTVTKNRSFQGPKCPSGRLTRAHPSACNGQNLRNFSSTC